MSGPLNVKATPAEATSHSPKDYLVRFVFGGIVTAITGLIVHRFGPVIGGLFLAFPAILPASLTLVERDDGRRAAGADAFGAIFGSLGLLAFGAVVWKLGTDLPAWAVLGLATLAWLAVSVGAWAAFESLRRAATAPEPRQEPARR